MIASDLAFVEELVTAHRKCLCHIIIIVTFNEIHCVASLLVKKMNIIATHFKGVFHTCKVTEVWLVLLLMKSADEAGFLVK